MPMRTFMIPVTDNGEACDALNQLTRHVRVLSIERRFVDLGLQSFWSIIVDYLEGKLEVSSGKVDSKSYRNKIDYRESLAPEVFAVYAQLRDFRKRLAQQEGVPVYTVFTNEQLAEIAKNKIDSKGALERVDGIGGARLQKYGDLLLQFIQTQLGRANEASTQPF